MSNDPAAFIAKHHKAAVKALQKHATHLYLVRRVLQELRRQLGDAGLKQWLALHCKSITWADAQLILSRPEQADINPVHLAEIFKEGKN